MPNLKNNLKTYETQTLTFINAFISWYYTSYNREPYSESLDKTLGRRMSSNNPFDCLNLDRYISQQAIQHSATVQELYSWYFENVHSSESDGERINLTNWLYLERQKSVTQK
jgi:hypothetical protein